MVNTQLIGTKLCLNITEGGRHGRKSKEFRARMSELFKGRIISESHRQKIGKANRLRVYKTGWKQSEYQKQQASNALTGRKRVTQVCPHCGIEGGVGNMTRWHFDNCKNKN